METKHDIAPKRLRAVVGVPLGDLLAPSFDVAGIPILGVARDLMARTGAHVRLVHAMESEVTVPWAGGPWIDGVSSAADAYHMLLDLRAAAERSAEARMREAAAEVGGGKAIAACVLKDVTPGAAIAEEASRFKADMIMIGSGPTQERFAARGLATILGIVAEARAPVLAVPDEAGLDVAKDRLKVFVADDLRAETEEALRAAAALVARWGKVDVMHVCAVPLAQRALADIAHMVRSAARQDLDARAMADGILQAVDRACVQKLTARAAPWRAELEELGGSYEARAVHGAPRDVLFAEAEQWQADIMVLGRHKTLHRHPVGLGRIPWRAMLERRTAVLLAT